MEWFPRFSTRNSDNGSDIVFSLLRRLLKSVSCDNGDLLLRRSQKDVY